MWELEPYIGFENQYKKFSKKHEDEASAALNNLQTYISVLERTNSVQVANHQPFVRREPDGMVAIDERGAEIDRKHGKLKATRLYVYAYVENETVYLLGIGDKDSQRQDIATCREKVRQIKGSK